MIVVNDNIEKDEILHIIVRREDLEGTNKRQDIISPENFLQCALLNLPRGTTFKPHFHIWKDHPDKGSIAQESWVVIQGRVRVKYYNLDNEILNVFDLGPGDASFTLAGGHTYEVLEDNTLVYEFKSGPYTGQENDKEFIKE